MFFSGFGNEKERGSFERIRLNFGMNRIFGTISYDGIRRKFKTEIQNVII